MRLQVSEYAAARLDDIWDYYAAEAGERVADRIIKKIVDDIDWLLERPSGGPYEPLLDHLGMGHRRKVSGSPGPRAGTRSSTASSTTCPSFGHLRCAAGPGEDGVVGHK